MRRASVMLLLLLAACGDSPALPSGALDAGLDSSAPVDLARGPVDATVRCGADGECPATLTCCGQTCVDTATDPAHCSTCAIACSPPHAVPRCAAGVCKISMCVVDFEDCDGQYGDGCEIYTAADKANCGSCGHACPGAQRCSLGSCG